MKSWYSHSLKGKILTVVAVMLLQTHGWCFAQRITFSTWTGSDDINISSPQGAFPALDFSQKKRVILPNSEAVSIDLNDNLAVIFELEAPSGYDLTVELSTPPVFVLADDPSQTIPFQMRMAYNNRTPTDPVSGKLQAQELPIGFSSITFPVNRNSNGLPTAPPSPEFGSFTRPKTKAYIYLYGSIGPVGNVPTGRYEAEININVSFTSND